MQKEDVLKLDTGLYIVHWKESTFSLASVGVTAEGGRWIGPVNWVAPMAEHNQETWDMVERVEVVMIDKRYSGGRGEYRVSVNAKALYQILNALNGPDHYIRELQATRSLDELRKGPPESPINILIEQFNAANLPSEALK